MKLKLFSLAFASALAVSSAHATCAAAYCAGAVERIYVDTEGVYIGMEGDETTLSPCTATASVYIRLPKTFPTFSEVLAVLMTAQAQARPVTIVVTGDAGECKVGYVYLDKP
jgi:hypothetical protein